MTNNSQEIPTSSRKKQLNVVYFIDSSRTRSFRMPLGRVNLLLGFLVLLLVWSIASVFLLFWLGDERRVAGERLRSAMATVFDYETRYDGAFEVAYPPDSKGQPSIATTLAKTKPTNAERQEAKPVSPLVASKDTTKESNESKGLAHKEATQVEPVDEEASPDPAPTPDIPVVPAAKSAATDPAASSKLPVTVDNPVVEAASNALELRFDLKSKESGETGARAEGYVWAVAEFKTDKGKTLYIGAPNGIEVKADGEPSFPKRSNKFAVRFFKRKKFSFPLGKNESGTFTGIRIGVMGNSGDERMIYKVPINIRVGSGQTTGNPPKTNPG